MRVCIPTETDQGMLAPLSQHFGTAPFFTLFDTESGATMVEPNPSCHSHSGACHHIGFLQARGVDAVACYGMGRRAFEGLQQAGLEVLQASGTTVEQVVRALAPGQRQPMSIAAACQGHGHDHGHGGHGGGSCQHSHEPHQHLHQHSPGRPGSRPGEEPKK